jgi:hypothetical protein
MAITLQEGLNQSKPHCAFFQIDLAKSRFSRSLSQISDNMTSTEAHQIERSTQCLSGKTMAPRTFDVKFPCGTQLTFGLLTFAAGEDRHLKMLPPGPAPEHLALASSSASGGSCSGSDPCAESYIPTIKIVQGIPVMTSILRPLAKASSSSTSTSTPNPDSFDDYPEIGANACGELTEGGRLICMVTGRTTPPTDIPP